MTDCKQILENLDQAYELLVEKYNAINAELIQAHNNGQVELYKALETQRDAVKTMYWAINEFQVEVAPSLYLEA